MDDRRLQRHQLTGHVADVPTEAKREDVATLQRRDRFGAPQQQEYNSVVVPQQQFRTITGHTTHLVHSITSPVESLPNPHAQQSYHSDSRGNVHPSERQNQKTDDTNEFVEMPTPQCHHPQLARERNPCTTTDIGVTAAAVVSDVSHSSPLFQQRQKHPPGTLSITEHLQQSPPQQQYPQQSDVEKEKWVQSQPQPPPRASAAPPPPTTALLQHQNLSSTTTAASMSCDPNVVGTSHHQMCLAIPVGFPNNCEGVILDAPERIRTAAEAAGSGGVMSATTIPAATSLSFSQQATLDAFANLEGSVGSGVVRPTTTTTTASSDGGGGADLQSFVSLSQALVQQQQQQLSLSSTPVLSASMRGPAVSDLQLTQFPSLSPHAVVQQQHHPLHTPGIGELAATGTPPLTTTTVPAVGSPFFAMPGGLSGSASGTQSDFRTTVKTEVSTSHFQQQQKQPPPQHALVATSSNHSQVTPPHLCGNPPVCLLGPPPAQQLATFPAGGGPAAATGATVVPPLGGGMSSTGIQQTTPSSTLHDMGTTASGISRAPAPATTPLVALPLRQSNNLDQNDNDGSDSNNKHNVYLASLPPSVREVQLRELFEPFGTILSMRVIHEGRAGKPRGIAFIHFEHSSSAEEVMRSFGSSLRIHGSKVQVRLADASPKGRSASVPKQYPQQYSYYHGSNSSTQPSTAPQHVHHQQAFLLQQQTPVMLPSTSYSGATVGMMPPPVELTPIVPAFLPRTSWQPIGPGWIPPTLSRNLPDGTFNLGQYHQPLPQHHQPLPHHPHQHQQQ